MLECAIVKAIPFRSSVRHTRDPRLDGFAISKCLSHNTTERCFWFLMPNFLVLIVKGFTPNNYVKERYPCRRRKFDQESAITWKRCQIGCKLVLLTNRKSRTGYRLVLKLVTLNDLECRNGPPLTLRYYAECVSFYSQLRRSFG